MLRFLKGFFKPKHPDVTPEPAAPYKIEAPRTPDVDAKASTQVKCGCGRSQSGFCVGLHNLTPEDWAVHQDNPAKPIASEKPKKAAAKKAPAKPKTEKKPAAIKAPAKSKAPKKPKAK